MSASHSSSSKSAPVALTAATKTQLDFGKILEFLQQGLIDFMACFSKDSDRSDEFKEKFTADLIRSPVNKQLYDQHGTLLIKAAYPKLYQLTHEEKDILQKMAIHPPQDSQTSINHFFQRNLIDEFLKSEVKDKYQPEMKNLVDAIYQFIVAMTYSVEYEQALLKIDKNGQPIADKDKKFGIQASIISGLDLQISEAINSVRLSTRALLKIKLEHRTEKTDSITESVGKMRAAIATGSAEYGKNLQASLSAELRRDNESMAAAAKKAQLDLLEAKEVAQSAKTKLEEQTRQLEIQQRQAKEHADQLEEQRLLAEEQHRQLLEAHERQVEEHRRQIQEQTHKTTELERLAAAAAKNEIAQREAREAAEKEIERVRAESMSQRNHSPSEVDSQQSNLSNDSQSSSSSVSSHNSAAAAAQDSLIEQLKKEKSRLEKQNRLLQEKAKAQAATDKLSKEIHKTEISSKDLTKVFDAFMVNLASPKLTPEILLQNLLVWEKAALAYTDKKKPNEGAESSAIASAFRFVGQKTGIGKKIKPQENMALKSELKTILMQSILMAELNMRGDVNEVVSILNQHIKFLEHNHKSSHLKEGTVSNQLLKITEAITKIAIDKFDYGEKAPRYGGGNND